MDNNLCLPALITDRLKEVLNSDCSVHFDDGPLKTRHGPGSREPAVQQSVVKVDPRGPLSLPVWRLLEWWLGAAEKVKPGWRKRSLGGAAELGLDSGRQLA